MIANNQGSDWGQALQCWRTVVAAAEAIRDWSSVLPGYPYSLVVDGAPTVITESFRQSFKFARRLVRPCRPIPALEGGAEVLFAMNYPSPATVGNLAPVIAEANRRGVPFAVLNVKSVRAGEQFCSAGCGTVTE